MQLYCLECCSLQKGCINKLGLQKCPPSTPQLRFKVWIGHHLYINKHAHIPNHRQITKNDCRYTTPWITVCRVLKQTLFYKVVPIHPQKQSALASIHNVILKLTCTPIPCFRPRTHTDLDKARLLRCRRRVNRNNGGSRISNHSPLKNKKRNCQGNDQSGSFGTRNNFTWKAAERTGWSFPHSYKGQLSSSGRVSRCFWLLCPLSPSLSLSLSAPVSVTEDMMQVPFSQIFWQK